MARKTPAPGDFEELLAYIKKARNYDPPLDRLSALQKACNHRTILSKLTSLKEYAKSLRTHPQEFTPLFDAYFGSRYRFFRESQDWATLKDLILPQLESRRATRDLRFWIVGCGTGQEVYTLAIILCEFLGESAFRDRVKIFGTDTDDAALQVARGAKYTEAEAVGLPDNLREKYFAKIDDRYVFRNELRACLTFGHLDLIEDPVMSRMDIILCRDVLVYFPTPKQNEVVNRISAALRSGGWLLLGRGDKLQPGAPLQRISADATLYCRFGIDEATAGFIQIGSVKSGGEVLVSAYYMAAFENSPVATICLDSERLLALANGRARATFGLLPSDIGRPLHDMELSYRPLDLRSLLDQSVRDNRPIECDQVSYIVPGRTQMFSICVHPFVDAATQRRTGFSIQFHDITEVHEAQNELTAVNHQLQTANEELQSSHEELETTNEELQSSNEELETANEELQSTNEELETMNEELQSTNSELEAANGQQRILADTVERNSAFLNSILGSMRYGLIVLNEKLEVLLWNEECRNLWGLRADETKGRSLFALDIGLPLDRLKKTLKLFLQLKKDFEQVKIGATNRRGKNIHCTISMTPFVNPDREGIVMLIDHVHGDDTGTGGE